MSKLAQFVLGCVFGTALAACFFIALYFRMFWRSDLGALSLFVAAWIVMSLALGWGGRGKPYSLRFGLIAGSITSVYLGISFLIAKYVAFNMYAGVALFFLLLYLSTKSKLFKERSRELSTDQDRSQFMR